MEQLLFWTLLFSLPNSQSVNLPLKGHHLAELKKKKKREVEENDNKWEEKESRTDGRGWITAKKHNGLMLYESHRLVRERAGIRKEETAEKNEVSAKTSQQLNSGETAWYWSDFNVEKGILLLHYKLQRLKKDSIFAQSCSM